MFIQPFYYYYYSRLLQRWRFNSFSWGAWFRLSTDWKGDRANIHLSGTTLFFSIFLLLGLGHWVHVVTRCNRFFSASILHQANPILFRVSWWNWDQHRVKRLSMTPGELGADSRVQGLGRALCVCGG